MTITAALIVVVILGVLVCAYARGYPNTVDAVAYRLHKHAKAVRKMHEARTQAISKLWVECLEENNEQA